MGEAPARLQSARLVMRPLAEDDIEEVHAVFTEPGVRRFLFDDTVLEPEQTRELLRRSGDCWPGRGSGLWGISLQGEAALLGCVGFWYFHEPLRLEPLFALRDACRGRGYAGEAARRMIEYGRGRLALDVVSASCDRPNGASARVLERLGFAETDRRLVAGRDTTSSSWRACLTRGKPARRRRGGSGVPDERTGRRP